MKTLLALATGVVILPALTGGAHARTTPAVRLETAIRTLSRTPDAVRYAVTVRPVGGTVHGVTLLLDTRWPARWAETAPGCMAAGDRTVQACDLGDLRASRNLRLTGRPGRSGAVPVFARAGAADAPAVMWSLGDARPAALAMPARRGSGPDSREPSPSASPSASASASAAPEQSPPAESPAVSPAVESPAVQDAPDSASPSASAPSTEESTEPEPARPLAGPARRVARPRPAPIPTSTPTSSPAARPTPAAPVKSATPSPATPPPAASAKVPAVPDLPLAPVTPPPLVPATRLPAASASNALPQIAPHSSPSEGISELSTLSPAGAMQAGRWSWATLIAVAAVTEAGLLWLVAGFTVWRRKRVRKPRARSRPLLTRLIP